MSHGYQIVARPASAWSALPLWWARSAPPQRHAHQEPTAGSGVVRPKTRPRGRLAPKPRADLPAGGVWSCPQGLEWTENRTLRRRAAGRGASGFSHWASQAGRHSTKNPFDGRKTGTGNVGGERPIAGEGVRNLGPAAGHRNGRPSFSATEASWRHRSASSMSPVAIRADAMRLPSTTKMQRHEAMESTRPAMRTPRPWPVCGRSRDHL